MSACACLGPQNGEPACPCRMRSGSYSPDWLRFQHLEGDFVKNGMVWTEDRTCPGRFMWQGVCKYDVKVIRLPAAIGHIKGGV